MSFHCNKTWLSQKALNEESLSEVNAKSDVMSISNPMTSLYGLA